VEDLGSLDGEIERQTRDGQLDGIRILDGEVERERGLAEAERLETKGRDLGGRLGKVGPNR
jgi:hypothetical protein